MSRWGTIRGSVLALLLWGTWGLRALAQDTYDSDEAAEWLDAAIEQGSALVESIDLAALQAEYGVRDADWNGFWTAATEALGGGSIEALAEVDPYAQEALAWMDTVPALSPTADWLRPRVDYFDAAASMLQDVAGVAPAPAPPAPAPRPVVKPAPRWPHVPAKPPPTAKPPVRHRPPAKAHRVDYWKERLAKRPAASVKRVEIPRLKAIFREEGVPEDLVWMAEAESTLNPAARSPAGAVGLFQFMPATAGRFGLKLKPTDERLEPEKSARAAAKYLRYLKGHFQDWPLAIAAYNAGEGRVGKALTKSKKKTFEGAAPHLPAETQMYVPKVLATIALREGREFGG